ncbi:MAG: glucose-1-phosphate adenylyltransferase [Pirellulales bacterium]|nr:glucose-1-phosphate adenylyltransferase [Pirellulales bacterium]
MNRIITLVLGGGQGTRLYPLTKLRSKPAVPLAGKYRLIDIPISNCINSGLNRIYVLTQFNSVSLHSHIRRAYNFDHFNGGFVEILAAQQTLDNTHWYQGTADAVRQNLRYIEQHDIEQVLILSGDQLYRMDYRDMLATHVQAKADVTIAALPVTRDQVSGLGIMRVDDTGRVGGFLEKPKTQAEVELVLTDPAWIDRQGIPSHGRDCLASMGIYIFNRDVLLDVLNKTDYRDFGKEVFPASIRTRRVQCHVFDGYWEDIGTIGSFFQANLDLTAHRPRFDIGSASAPIYSSARFLPASRFDGATIRRSLIADGCQIHESATIEDSVIGVRCVIGPGVTLRKAIVMGADFYETAAALEENRQQGRPCVGIGEGSVIEGAIIDKNCRIGRRVHITNPGGVVDSEDHPEYIIRDSVVVVPRGTTIADDWRLSG